MQSPSELSDHVFGENLAPLRRSFNSGYEGLKDAGMLEIGELAIRTRVPF
jgi:hypothetical protein